MMGTSDGLWARRKVAEKIRLRITMLRLTQRGNCLKSMVAKTMLLISI
jgi:hypothetical protein